ncbi:MAG: hypothetical protein COB66_08265 [Coxiella sp. (in: Bacteria)]|nr:MAG: hypothetical protein COB66_08265 [Coxiella sp. (in: g-proteobacteria)]
MVNINLLAMKSDKTKHDRSRFLLSLFLPIGLGVVILFFVHFHYAPMITSHQAQNTAIQKQITLTTNQLVDEKILAADETKTKRIINAFNTIKRARFYTIHLFKLISEFTPKNVYLLNLSNNKGKIQITGQTLSKKAVSNLLDRLSEINFITKPKLGEIITNKETHLNGFKIDFQLKTQSPFYTIKKEVKK